MTNEQRLIIIRFFHLLQIPCDTTFYAVLLRCHDEFCRFAKHTVGANGAIGAVGAVGAAFDGALLRLFLALAPHPEREESPPETLHFPAH